MMRNMELISKGELMSINNEYTNFPLAQTETSIDQPVSRKPQPGIPSVPPTPRKTRLERLPLSETTSSTIVDLSLLPTLRLEAISQGLTAISQTKAHNKISLKNIYTNIVTDPLYRNSLFNMASTFILGGLGFVFWIIIARLYKTEYVGIATTLISIMTLLSSFTVLGLNASLNRFLPKSTSKNDLINSTFVVVTIATILACAIFLLGLQTFSPQLVFLQSNFFYSVSFILFVIFCAWNVLVDCIFIAFRAAGNILIKNSIISVLKLVLPFIFVALGAYGIFASAASAFALGVLAGLVILILFFNVKPSISVNVSLLKKHAAYSFASYISNFMLNMPPLLLPVIILNVLSAQYAAYYYIASMIQSILQVIPLATAQSLITEGSYDEAELRRQVKKAFVTIATILVPAILVIVLAGNILLQFFGKNYAQEAFQFLQLYSVSTIFTAILLVCNAIMNIKHQIKSFIFLNTGSSLLTIWLSYTFISGKLVGIGWGWTLGQAITGGAALFFIVRNIYAAK